MDVFLLSLISYFSYCFVVVFRSFVLHCIVHYLCVVYVLYCVLHYIVSYGILLCL